MLNARAGIEALSQFFELKQIVHGVKQLIAPNMTQKSLGRMLKATVKRLRCRITVGKDKNYEVQSHVVALRQVHVTPHVVQNDSVTQIARSRSRSCSGSKRQWRATIRRLQPGLTARAHSTTAAMRSRAPGAEAAQPGAGE